jgi:hypothetical protein
VNLEVLDLRNTGVTDSGLRHLAGMTNLKELYLADTEVTQAGAAELKEILPGLAIYR